MKKINLGSNFYEWIKQKITPNHVFQQKFLSVEQIFFTQMHEKASIFLHGTEEKNISYLIELFLYQYVLRHKYPVIIVKNIPRYFAFGSWKKKFYTL